MTSGRGLSNSEIAIAVAWLAELLNSSDPPTNEVERLQRAYLLGALDTLRLVAPSEPDPRS